MIFDRKLKNGATARIRTWDPNIRSVVFYPAELRLHCAFIRERLFYIKWGLKSRAVLSHALIW